MNAGLVLASHALSGTSASTTSDAPANIDNMLGFGAVLSALSQAVNGAPADGQKQGLTKEQTILLQDVAQLLQTNSLSDVEGGLELGRGTLLDETQLESHPILEALLHGGITEDALKKLVTSLQETGQMKVTNTDSKETGELKSSDDADMEDTDTLEENLQPLLSMGITDLLSIVKAIAGLDTEQLEKIDLKSASAVLKFAKVQELLTAFKDMSAKDAALTTELKSLLETISGKVQKLLESDAKPTSGGTSFAKELTGANTKNINIIKSVYTRLSDGLNQESSKNGGKENISIKQSEASQAQPVHFQISKLEQFVLATEKGGQKVNQEQFIKAFENILSKANFTNANGMQKLFIKLNPEHLGALRIEIIQKDSGLVANIIATTSKAKELLDTHIQGLKHAFNGQNLHIEKIEVSQAMNSFTQERFLQRDSDGSQQRSKQQQQQPSDQQQEDEGEFTADLETALLNLKA